MTAVTIMLTALRQIFANFGQVMRIFLLPCLTAVAIIIGGVWIAYDNRNISEPAVFALMLAAGVCALWATVNFHRHILLGERFGWLPRLHLRETAGYGIMLIPIWLVLAGCTWVIAIVGTEVMFGANGGDQGLRFAIPRMVVFTLVSSTLLGALALRLHSLLPGLAIGAALHGYTRPRGSIPTILLIALILSGLRTAYSMRVWLIMTQQLDPPTIMFILKASGVANLIIAIFVPIYAVSLLTVLYAQYVGKPAT